MRIGSDSSYLVLASDESGGARGSLIIEAHASSFEFKLSARHDGVYAAGGRRTVKEFEAFSHFMASEVEVPLTDGGWLRFSRTARGYVEVRYRLSASSASAASEGQVLVDGEYANEMCAQFSQLLIESR